MVTVRSNATSEGKSSKELNTNAGRALVQILSSFPQLQRIQGLLAQPGVFKPLIRSVCYGVSAIR